MLPALVCQCKISHTGQQTKLRPIGFVDIDLKSNRNRLGAIDFDQTPMLPILITPMPRQQHERNGQNYRCHGLVRAAKD